MAAMFLVSILALLGPAQVQSSPRQAFLKVNQFYILYTNPIVPQHMKSTDFLVGLQAFALILNAKAFTDAQATTTTLVKGTHRIKITAGSRTALVDGEPVRWPRPPC